MGRAGGEGSQRAGQQGGSKGKEECEARGEHEAGNGATRQDAEHGRPRRGDPQLPRAPLSSGLEPAAGSWEPASRTHPAGGEVGGLEVLQRLVEGDEGHGTGLPRQPCGEARSSVSPPGRALPRSGRWSWLLPEPPHPRRFWDQQYLAGSPPAPPIPPALSAPPRCSLPREARAGGKKWGRPGGGCSPPAALSRLGGVPFPFPAPHTAATRPPAEPKPGAGGSTAPRGFPPREGSRRSRKGGGQITGGPPEHLQEAGLPRSRDLSRERDAALSGAAPRPPPPPRPPPLTPDTPGTGGDSGGSSGGAGGALMACGGKAAPVSGGPGGPQRSPMSPPGVPSEPKGPQGAPQRGSPMIPNEPPKGPQ